MPRRPHGRTARPRLYRAERAADFLLAASAGSAGWEKTLNDPNEDLEQQPPQLRAPYQKPAVLWEEMLEVRKTLAVACAKVSGQSAICNQFPTS